MRQGLHQLLCTFFRADNNAQFISHRYVFLAVPQLRILPFKMALVCIVVLYIKYRILIIFCTKLSIGINICIDDGLRYDTFYLNYKKFSNTQKRYIWFMDLQD